MAKIAENFVSRRGVEPDTKRGLTMPIEFLTHEEICQLTGARTRAGQIENLRRNGVRHTIKRNGWPCVTVNAVTGEGPKEEPVIPWRSSKAP